MCPRYAEVTHQRAHMRRLPRDADRPRDAAATRIADAMKTQHPIASGERRLFQQGPEPIREQACGHQHHRLPGVPCHSQFAGGEIVPPPTG